MERVKVTIEKLPLDYTQTTSLWQGLLSPFRSFFNKIHNTYKLIRHGELLAPMTSGVCPFRKIGVFDSFHMNNTITMMNPFMRTVLKHPRKDRGGLFFDYFNSDIFVPLLNDIFPDLKITEEDFLLTCSNENVVKFRQPIIRFIGPQQIRKHAKEMNLIVESVFSHWDDKFDRNEINALEFANVYTTCVISRMLLGHPGPFNVYQEISQSIDFLFAYMTNKMTMKKIGEQEKQRYQESVECLRECVNLAYTTNEKPHLGSLVDVMKEDKGMSESEIKTTLMLMYLGGSETSSSLLAYILWQLGNHPDYQQEIYNEIVSKDKDLTWLELANELDTVDKLFVECIRLYTPAYLIGRQCNEDLLYTVYDDSGDVVERNIVCKGQGLVSSPFLAGRDPTLFSDSDTFNPHRFDTQPRALSWLPFGDGKHSCPGQWLAKAEIVSLVTAMVKQYHITSSKKEMDMEGFLTLKIKDEPIIKVSRRLFT